MSHFIISITAFFISTSTTRLNLTASSLDLEIKNLSEYKNVKNHLINIKFIFNFFLEFYNIIIYTTKKKQF